MVPPHSSSRATASTRSTCSPSPAGTSRTPRHRRGQRRAPGAIDTQPLKVDPPLDRLQAHRHVQPRGPLVADRFELDAALLGVGRIVFVIAQKHPVTRRGELDLQHRDPLARIFECDPRQPRVAHGGDFLAALGRDAERMLGHGHLTGHRRAHRVARRIDHGIGLRPGDLLADDDPACHENDRKTNEKARVFQPSFQPQSVPPRGARINPRLYRLLRAAASMGSRRHPCRHEPRRPRRGEAPRDGGAEALGSAGYDGDLFIETVHLGSP